MDIFLRTRQPLCLSTHPSVPQSLFAFCFYIFQWDHASHRTDNPIATRLGLCNILCPFHNPDVGELMISSLRRRISSSSPCHHTTLRDFPVWTVPCDLEKYEVNVKPFQISCFNGPLTRYVKLQIAHASGMPVRFPRHRRQRKPIVSDHSMHHGTCVTHVPCCKTG